MSRNKAGAITNAQKEWGNKARKREEQQTGVARQAELDAINEGWADQFDDDPNPYHGTYSED